MIRRAFPEIPPRVEYELSQAGIDLMPMLREMRD
ncbi:MAG: winged helix-turn-helix transcriptional regulator [Luteibacter jiangsuensis]